MLLLYHLVLPVEYRRGLIDQDLGESIKVICMELSERYEIHFIKIGTDEDHVRILYYLVRRMVAVAPFATDSIPIDTGISVSRILPDAARVIETPRIPLGTCG